MKLIGKSLEKDASGYISLVPEEAEDMWVKNKNKFNFSTLII